MNRSIGAIFWGIAALVFMLLGLRDFQIDGALDVKTDFRRPTPYVSLLGPPTRVAYHDTDGVRIVAEPVYFDLRLPRWFRNADVTVLWSGQGATTTPRLGVWLDPEHPDRTDAPVALFASSSATFPLHILPRSRYGLRLLIAAPGVSSSTPIIVTGLVVHATR